MDALVVFAAWFHKVTPPRDDTERQRQELDAILTTSARLVEELTNLIEHAKTLLEEQRQLRASLKTHDEK